MSQNFNHRNLEHAISLRRNPANATATQAAFNQKRLARIEKAIPTRPVYIPLKFNLDAVGQISPYQNETPLLPYDVIITGIISSNTSRRVALRESIKDLPFVIVGEKRNLHLSLADIAGRTSLADKGQKGIFNLPSPITVKDNSRLYIDVYKTDDTPEAESVNIVLVGTRVIKNSEMDDDVRKSVVAAIANRSIPKTIFLKHEIDYGSGLAGKKAKNIYTPRLEEPILIRGCRSSMKQSLINIGIEGEPDWTTGDMPIWGISAEDDNQQDSYLYFSRPVFMAAERVLGMTLENSIDGVNIDEQINELTWICELM